MKLRLPGLVVASAVLASSILFASPPPASAAVINPVLVWDKTTPGRIMESSPVITDLDLDGTKDIVIGTDNGQLFALRSNDRSVLAGWPRTLSTGIDSTPSIWDVSGDAHPEIFVGSGLPAHYGGDFYSLNHDGSQRWHFHPSDPDFASLAMFSSPAIGDVNNDGRADVSAFSLGLLGWSFDVDGRMNPGWPFYQDDTVFSSPALFDVDDDGQTDYVVGGDSTPGGPVDHKGGFLRALRGDGSLIWAVPLDQMMRSSPVVGDIDNDGQPEIVVGTGDSTEGGPDGSRLFVFRKNGTLKWYRDLGAYTPGSPALADVNGDGKLDIIEGGWGSPTTRKLWVFDGTTGNALPHFGPHDTVGGPVLGQPVTADLDGDGGQDILIGTGAGVWAFSGKTGAELFNLKAGVAGYINTSWIGDLDNDNKLDIVIAGGLPNGTSGDTGLISRYELPTTTGTLGANNWSQFRHDNRLTGSLLDPPLRKDFCAPNPGKGYWMTAADGGMFSFCEAQFKGSLGGQHINAPIVSMATAPPINGYWMVGTDGGVYAFGNAPYKGSMGGTRLNQPIVGMAATPSGNGYWLVARDGGIFSFGDAPFKGSMGGTRLNQPIVGIATTPSGNGYWMVASDGGIFSFGDAGFKGSTGSMKLNSPIVGMTAKPSGDGYWLVASDGGLFAFNAPFMGSMGASKLNKPIVGMARGSSGYRMVASDGGIFSFGEPFLGSTGSMKLNSPIVSMASIG